MNARAAVESEIPHPPSLRLAGLSPSGGEAQIGSTAQLAPTRAIALAPRSGERVRVRGRTIAALLSLSVLAACCAHAQPVARPYPAPAPDALIAALSAQQAAVRGMNARVRATSWLGGERVRATVNMLVERDGHLRFEAEVSLQGTVAVLATDGATFALYDAHRNEFSRGPACPANVASMVRIPLAPADVAAVLLGDGRPPAPIDPAAATVGWDARRGADVLAVPVREGGTLQFLFHGDGAARALVAVIRIGANGAPLWQTAYEDHETVGGARVPGVIRFAEQTSSFDDGVEIKFKERTINAAPAAGAFTLTPPAGATVVDVGCGAAPQ
jgi:outer membrane lipoprotein-sorting protein